MPSMELIADVAWARAIYKWENSHTYIKTIIDTTFIDRKSRGYPVPQDGQIDILCRNSTAPSPRR
ncbi:hypothetical protein THOM_0060 [Trachipleistophora hominis]|uniref:Uncharacterized protein n=1 Tax=Trachipleistophora hominis TaxID=72359 RepID=L7JZQ0_TRAHO|nr:hypothetical protein THOM_0060 [Trachipleistophora hominis]